MPSFRICSVALTVNSDALCQIPNFEFVHVYNDWVSYLLCVVILFLVTLLLINLVYIIQSTLIHGFVVALEKGFDC